MSNSGEFDKSPIRQQMENGGNEKYFGDIDDANKTENGDEKKGLSRSDSVRARANMFQAMEEQRLKMSTDDGSHRISKCKNFAHFYLWENCEQFKTFFLVSILQLRVTCPVHRKESSISIRKRNIVTVVSISTVLYFTIELKRRTMCVPFHWIFLWAAVYRLLLERSGVKLLIIQIVHKVRSFVVSRSTFPYWLWNALYVCPYSAMKIMSPYAHRKSDFSLWHCLCCSVLLWSFQFISLGRFDSRVTNRVPDEFCDSDLPLSVDSDITSHTTLLSNFVYL